MPALHLENVPESLYQQLESLAAADQVPLADEALRLLQEAVGQRPVSGVITSATAPARSQREILDDIARLRFTAKPGTPSSVEMLREDRAR